MTEEQLTTAETETTTEEPPKRIELEVAVTSPSACERHFLVTVPRTDIERYFTDAFSELMPKAEVPGFRAGRAPRKLVERAFKERVADQVKGKLIMDSMTQITAESKFSAISEPKFDFDAVTLPPDGPMKFEFDIEVRPEFEMPKWEGLAIKRPTHSVNAEEVDAARARMLARYGHLAPYDGPAAKNDIVILNATFRDGDLEVARMIEENVEIRHILSFADARLEGFDDLMVGAVAGDLRTAKVTVLPGAEREALAGKTLEVEFEVLEVKRVELPELNSAFLDRIGGFDSADELDRLVKKELERQFGYHQQKAVRTQITEQLTKGANWELPPDLVRRQSRRELERAVLEMRSSGMSEDQIKMYANELRQNSMRTTELALKEHFILERLAEENQIEADPNDYDKEIELIADQSDESPRRIRARLEKNGQMDSLRNQIIERRVIDLIVEKANVTETVYVPPKNEQRVVAIDFAVARDIRAEIPEAKPGADPEPLPGDTNKEGAFRR